MATPVENRPVSSGEGAEPTVLRDERGESILPLEPLRGVDFGAHLESGHGEETDGAEPRRSGGSYFTNTPGETTTDDIRNPLKKVKTAPAENGRPSTLARNSTLLRTMRRRSPQDERFQYTFDPMSSDSESSSSEDESTRRKERPPAKRTRTAEEVKEQEQEQTQAKEDAKKGKSYSRFRISNEHMSTKGRVSKRDGRLNISINQTANSGYLAKALGHTIQNHLDIPNRSRARKQRQHLADHPELDPDVDLDAEKIASALYSNVVRPKLNIVIMVIGSRGDIQPFLKIGKILREEHGHRVRIATHPTFREFVEKETDLEFFSVGGDPSELMAFMVKNPGLIPSLQTIREGEIHRRRVAMGEMFEGMWRACTNTTDDDSDSLNIKMMGDKAPFVADAIIANPPSMAHVHIAERLGIPLHIMFTFPYSPTQAFPHPLANIKPGKSNVDTNYVNFMSYPLVEMMTWQGLGDIVNKFRQRVLGLEPVSSLWAPGALYRMKVSYTYMWSPSLVPKPGDWGPEIDIAGFVFMDLAKMFKPPQDLVDFLNAGDPPVYIGFGSIVVDDPDQFTKILFEATKLAGVRALVNKGWGGLGHSNENTPDHIFMLGNTPHDWLFPKVKAVVHHGGAGTTAIGLKCAKPTMIVPFFGDQPFWAARVAEAKAGAHEVIPWKKLTPEKMAEGIKQCLTEEAQINVRKLAEGIEKEGDGAENAVKSFHRSLPLAGPHSIRCSILEDRVAVWQLKGSSLRLSALAAELLMEKGKLKTSDLRLFRACAWADFDGPGEPISGTAGAVTDSLYNIGGGVGMVPVRVAKHMKKRAEHEKKKAEIQKRKENRKEEKRQRKAAQVDEKQQQQLQRPPNDRQDTSNTLSSKLSADPSTPLAHELARDFHEGFKRSGAALLTMPNDLHVAIAQGFHNAPRLWGDATVRKPIRVTGFKTGLVAARKELIYGVWDGWTGLVTQPIGGFKDGDTIPSKLAGFGTGVGKGVGGFVLKNVSAVVSPPAYIGKGMIVYIKKKAEHNGPGSKAYIRKAHLIQGQKDLQALLARGSHDKRTEEIRERVDYGWKVYEQVWSAANTTYNAVGANVAGKLKLRREKRRWIESGALENVDAAERALRVRQEGKNLERHFARRRREVRVAELPRAPAMEQPERYEDSPNVLPNGRRSLSESTAVATPEEEGHAKKAPKDSMSIDGGRGSVAKLDFGKGVGNKGKMMNGGAGAGTALGPRRSRGLSRVATT
ncbi:glycosyltransferase family 1 protein [Zasmidium cellare ATCC 36951]|uniref:Glycosyltransferase family 1 protein n=1 Tax=Zasmidium cellare ATCC 36951 TaxID=1080233 RepID=A0A6A6C966_ZASCE|nr:glycosyltransferase family 1 protein [Zasmidium cellare ATCC 36951]KAF2163684.1 glycosyltransferase family 1 protein [Zasmidium cellare ATCC 36951]